MPGSIFTFCFYDRFFLDFSRLSGRFLPLALINVEAHRYNFHGAYHDSTANLVPGDGVGQPGLAQQVKGEHHSGNNRSANPGQADGQNNISKGDQTEEVEY